MIELSSDRELIRTWKKQGISNVEIGKVFGVSEATIRRLLKKYNKAFEEKIDLNINSHITLEPPFTHIGEAIVTADWHFPLFSPEMGNLVIETAQTTKIDTLIIAGDLFNLDALSRFEPKQDSAEIWAEIVVSREVICTLLKLFKRIYIIKGNHDERVVKALGYKLKFDKAMQLLLGIDFEDTLNKILFSSLDHMWVKPYENAPSWLSWYICHPIAYTQNPLSKGRIIADKYNANVITAHSHHFAMGWARDGKKIVAEAGGLFDTTKTEYLQASTSYPEWTNGFLMLTYQDKLLGLSAPTSLWLPRHGV